MKDLKNNKPIAIAGALVIFGLIIAVGLWSSAPTSKTRRRFPLPGGPSNHQPIIHQAYIDKFGINFLPGYEFLGTGDMLAYKPGGKESEVDYTGVQGAQFGSSRMCNSQSEIPRRSSNQIW